MLSRQVLLVNCTACADRAGSKPCCACFPHNCMHICAGKPLSEETLAKTLDAAATALQLDQDKADILSLVQVSMSV